MSTCRWTGRPRSEWSASNRPIAPIAPTIGPPAHFYVRDIGNPATRRSAEAIAKPNQPVPVRREKLAQRRMTPIFVPLWFGWGVQNAPQRRPFRAVPRRLPQQPDSVAEQSEFELPVPVSKLSDDSIMLEFATARRIALIARRLPMRSALLSRRSKEVFRPARHPRQHPAR